MNVRSVREQLRAAVTDMGYRPYDVLPESGQLPLAAVQWPESIEYHVSLGDSVRLDITVTVAVAASDFAKAQRQIDDVMSTPGFGEAIEEHNSGGAWRSVVCTSASNVRRLTVGSAEALAVDFSLQLHAS